MKIWLSLTRGLTKTRSVPLLSIPICHGKNRATVQVEKTNTIVTVGFTMGGGDFDGDEMNFFGTILVPYTGNAQSEMPVGWDQLRNILSLVINDRLIPDLINLICDYGQPSLTRFNN